MANIKAIIFDFGKVIYDFDNRIFLEEISKFSDKSVYELYALIYLSNDVLPKYETGLISSDEFFNKVIKDCNLSIAKQEFIEAHTNKFTPIRTTIDLIKKLKPNYKLGLLSNTNEWDFEYSIKPTEVFSLFDIVTLSFEIKAMKPRREIYLDALNKLGLSPEKCVYIDDIFEYVEAAKNIGIHGIQYLNHSDLVKNLKELGVKLY